MPLPLQLAHDFEPVPEVAVGGTLAPARPHGDGHRGRAQSREAEQEPLGAVRGGIGEANAEHLEVTRRHRDVMHRSDRRTQR
jgi:hypothetical protein